MRKALLALAIILAGSSEGYAMDSLSTYAWKNRVLLLFAEAGSAKLEEQVAALKRQAADLEERDMVVLHVGADKVTPIYGNGPGSDAAQIRSDAESGGTSFEVVLVGKDGGIKLRSPDIVSEVELFDLIDRMPMRRAEGG
ncbi:DUF4174 domain-containing protein [Rhizobium sp. SSA_523]|uniref:DUF4174 domain-containing protein n=1 Tax=Rhizobium sp. SSA_523 TaxID=2952477 RepID=UPI002091A01F|nr:DUF4174 domain-containing protein [Rhizobium sp. SSA_523]MCO5733723.1 DUF4174 domain-containing protein [Rhizobium sp. SSA_523]WKC25001.1 DUF4174 domain-containing protein [Rhizobium sp. SSA_523]